MPVKFNKLPAWQTERGLNESLKEKKMGKKETLNCSNVVLWQQTFVRLWQWAFITLWRPRVTTNFYKGGYTRPNYSAHFMIDCVCIKIMLVKISFSLSGLLGLLFVMTYTVPVYQSIGNLGSRSRCLKDEWSFWPIRYSFKFHFVHFPVRTYGFFFFFFWLN